MPARIASAPPPIAQVGVLESRSSKNPGSGLGSGALAMALGAAFGGGGASAFGASALGASAFGASALGGSTFAAPPSAARPSAAAPPALRVRSPWSPAPWLRAPSPARPAPRQAARRRGCALPRRRFGLRLDLRHRRALELHGLLQVLDRLLERGDAHLRFAKLLVARHGVLCGGARPLACGGFARHPKLVAARLRGRRLFLDRGADAPGRRASRGAFGRGRGRGDAVAVAAPVGGLDAHDARGLLRRRRGNFLRRGHRDDRARAQAIHVAAVERAGVALEQRDEHLVERHRRGLHVVRDLGKRVAAPDGDPFARGGGRLRRSGRRRGRGCRGVRAREPA